MPPHSSSVAPHAEIFHDRDHVDGSESDSDEDDEDEHDANHTHDTVYGHSSYSRRSREGVSSSEGNDLLLTTCADGSARIFGQSHWKPLTEWTLASPLTTRVEWVQGMAAMTLGDLMESNSSGSAGGGASTSKNATLTHGQGPSGLSLASSQGDPSSSTPTNSYKVTYMFLLLLSETEIPNGPLPPSAPPGKYVTVLH